jgi:stage II sporulation protein D
MLPWPAQWGAFQPVPPVTLRLRTWAPLLPFAALAVPALVMGGDRTIQARSGEPEVRVLLAEAGSLQLQALNQPLVIQPGGVELAPSRPASLVLENGRLHLRLDSPSAGGPASAPLPRAGSVWLAPRSGAGSDQAGAFQLGQRRYRGRLQVLVSGGRLQAINHVPLESYLPSVVGSEMPASWPQEALRAQAVAARTYALRQRKPSAPFDVSATVTSQVYKGLEAETASTRAAVASTRGQVLMYGSSLANTVFHSSAGGVTENSGDLWTQQLPYLVSVPDFDQGSPVHSWEQRLEPAQLREAFAEIGGVTRIDVLSTTGSGRVRQARVLGPAGTKVVTGPELRSRLRLRSTQVRFEVVLPEVAMVPPSAPPLPAGDETPADSATGAPGQAAPTTVPSPLPSAAPLQVPQPSLLAIGRGFGHGVGMSQWGALAMAQKGDTYERILQHYYRGTALRPYPAQP